MRARVRDRVGVGVGVRVRVGMAAWRSWSGPRSSCAKEMVVCSAVPLHRVSTSRAAKALLGGGISIVAASTK